MKCFLSMIIMLTLCLASCGDSKPVIENEVQVISLMAPRSSKCGAYKWPVNFKLTKRSPKGGWLVEKIHRKMRYTQCGSGMPTEEEKTYWLAWYINADEDTTWSRKRDTLRPGDYTGVLFTDTYNSAGRGLSKGKEEIRGELKFFEGMQTLPPEFQLFNKETNAEHLPSTMKEPEFWEKGGSSEHSLTVHWDCCGKNEVRFKTVP